MSAQPTETARCARTRELEAGRYRERLLAEGPLFDFADCVLNVHRSSLFVNGTRVQLPHRSWNVLLVLLAERHRVVGSPEIATALRETEAVPLSVAVPVSAVAATIYALRKKMGDDGHTQRIIKNIYGRGYKFVATTHSCNELRGLTQNPSRQ